AARGGDDGRRGGGDEGPERSRPRRLHTPESVPDPGSTRARPRARRLPSGGGPCCHELAKPLPDEPAYEQGYELRHAGVGKALNRLVGGEVDGFLGHPAPVFGLDRADLRFDLPEHGRVESSSHAYLLNHQAAATP